MSKNILLADDSLTIQKVVELTFMDEDFEVEAVGSGDEALSRLETALPNILIADVHMPGASGYEVCRQAKAKSYDLPVLLLVGTFEALDENEMVACGADGHLKKPFDSQELLQVVHRMTRGAAPTLSAPATAPVQGLEGTHHGDFESLDDTHASSVAGFTIDDGGLESEPELAPVDLDFDDPATDEPEVSGFRSAGIGSADIGSGSIGDEGTGDEGAADEGTAYESTADESTADESEGGFEERGSETVLIEGLASSGREPVVEAPAVEAPAVGTLSDADVDRVARRVVELMSADTVREVAWDVIPDLAEIVIKDRIRELEAEVE